MIWIDDRLAIEKADFLTALRQSLLSGQQQKEAVMQTRTADGAEIKLCPSYPGYGVTKDGRVFSYHGDGRYSSIDYNRTPYLMKMSVNRNGYKRVLVCPRRKTTVVHHMMADAFIAPYRKHMWVRHLDDNKTNNVVCNLAYGTIEDNAKDQIRNGRTMTGSKNHRSKLREADVLCIRELVTRGITIRSIALAFNVRVGAIYAIQNRQTWRHI